MKDYKLDSFTGIPHIDYEDNLNPQQLNVVKNSDGPCLVLAGAGSGKTRVLIYRLAYLLEHGIPQSEILLVTFTNKAAIEMLHRAESLVKSTLSSLWAGTFHHIGNIILRKEAHFLGYTSAFSIIDQDDSLSYIAESIEDLGILQKGTMFPKKDIISKIWSLSVNTQKSVEKVIEEFMPQVEEYTTQIKQVILRYKNKKKDANTMDFCDLLNNWLKLLRIPEILNKYANMFKYILVDEYQDTNNLQFEILKALSSVNSNLLAVGDDAQSIYSFRAADISNILDFSKNFENTKIFKLETNYRSSPQILNMANNIIRNNVKQFPKTLHAVKPDNETPAIIKTKDIYQQAHFIAQRVLEFLHNGQSLKDIAVLFRSRFQAIELEVELLKRNIPYLVRGGVRFFEQAHIKDVLSYMRFVSNEKDEISFKRAVGLHKGIGRGYSAKLWKKIQTSNNLPEIKQSLPKRAQEGFSSFLTIYNNLKNTETPQDAIKAVLSSYKEYCYLNFENPDERIQDIEELSKLAQQYASITAFLTEFNAYEEFKGETLLSASEQNEVLVLSTIHQSKGLEWNTVFIIGFNEYDFPHPKALAESDNLEEERRLFYVAVTRAKNILYITYPETKFTFKNGVILVRPSMFFYELPEHTYEEWQLRY
ncbi:MAG: ATP-dependent helicase [Candidatus Omnitrophica bacterium]|nr:ATP-dependent helicase [Candidatus Omnitrophota bacterium]MDD5081724.1 ATP-dependent helicase [Candidatus Omnitrophota bacterium]MDD5441703.1 ATP-dependent helicase [Candidatus Omnitrophota bacterium]